MREHGGTASVLGLSPRDDAQRDEMLALFDRSEAYAQWRAGAQTLQVELASLARNRSAPALAIGVSEALQALRRIDYYPGAAAEQAQADLRALREALDARFSRGEPVARAAHGDRRGWTGAASRASAGPRARGPGSTAWPAPG